MLMTRVEKYKLEEEMAVLCSSVWMAMLYCLCEKGEYRMILSRGKVAAWLNLVMRTNTKRKKCRAN